MLACNNSLNDYNGRIENISGNFGDLEFIQLDLMENEDLHLADLLDLNNPPFQDVDRFSLTNWDHSFPSSSKTPETSRTCSSEIPMETDFTNTETDNTNFDRTPSTLNNHHNRHKKFDDSPISRKTLKIVNRMDEAPKNCHICGAPTINFHYDAASCNSCKTFFRRCVILSKFYKCKSHRNCDLNWNQHPYNPCKGCRLGKCIAVGMNPAAIRFPKNLDVKNCHKKFEDFKNDILPLYLTLALKSPQDKIFNEINELKYIENKMRRLRESSYHPRNDIFSSIQEILVRPTELANAEKYDKPQEWPLSMDDIYTQIMERIKNMAISGELGRRPPDLSGRRFWIATDNIITIDAAKTLPFFKLLSLDDQAILLRHISLVNTNLMECYYSYKNNQDTIVMPDGTIPFKLRLEINDFIKNKRNSFFGTTALYYIGEIFKICRANRAYQTIGMIQRFLDYTPVVPLETLEDLYIRVLEPLKRVNLTENEYVILKTIIYSYHALPELSDYAKSILQKESEKYAQLLLKYLQFEHGDARGAQKYAEVISLMTTFFQYAEKHRQIHLLHKLSRETFRKEFIFAQQPKLMDEIMHLK